MEYNNEETFKELEGMFKTLDDTSDLHALVEDIYQFIDEINKQPEMSTDAVLTNPDETLDQQEFIDDTLNFVGQATAVLSKRSEDKKPLREYKRTLLKYYVIRYGKRIELQSQFQDEDFNDVEIHNDNYVYAKDTILVRVTLPKLAEILDDYLHRI